LLHTHILLILQIKPADILNNASANEFLSFFFSIRSYKTLVASRSRLPNPILEIKAQRHG